MTHFPFTGWWFRFRQNCVVKYLPHWTVLEQIPDNPIPPAGLQLANAFTDRDLSDLHMESGKHILSLWYSLATLLFSHYSCDKCAASILDQTLTVKTGHGTYILVEWQSDNVIFASFRVSVFVPENQIIPLINHLNAVPEEKWLIIVKI